MIELKQQWKARSAVHSVIVRAELPRWTKTSFPVRAIAERSLETPETVSLGTEYQAFLTDISLIIYNHAIYLAFSFDPVTQLQAFICSPWGLANNTK